MDLLYTPCYLLHHDTGRERTLYVYVWDVTRVRVGRYTCGTLRVYVWYCVLETERDSTFALFGRNKERNSDPINIKV